MLELIVSLVLKAKIMSTRNSKPSWVSIAALLISLLSAILYGPETVDSKIPAIVSSVEKSLR